MEHLVRTGLVVPSFPGELPVDLRRVPPSRCNLCLPAALNETSLAEVAVHSEADGGGGDSEVWEVHRRAAGREPLGQLLRMPLETARE